jgi:secreted trypsin-like serine protease
MALLFYKVLTAAHCQPQQTGALSVLLGVTDSDNPNSPHAVTKGVRRVIRHPQFNPRSYENDIAILELDSPVQFQPNIVPICLPNLKETFVGKKGFVTGMGLLKHGKNINFKRNKKSLQL